jgi:hypothetical protein
LRNPLAQEFHENDFQKARFAAKVFSKTVLKNPLQKRKLCKDCNPDMD